MKLTRLFYHRHDCGGGRGSSLHQTNARPIQVRPLCATLLGERYLQNVLLYQLPTHMAEVLFDTQLPLAAHQGLGPRSFPDNRTWTSSCIREASTHCDDFREEGFVLESHLQGLQSIVAMRARQNSRAGLKEQSDIFSTRGLLSLPSGHKQLFNGSGNSYRYCPKARQAQ